MNEDLSPGPIVVLMEDDLIHTDEHPECDDPTCYCHGEQSSVEVVVLYEDVTAAVDLNPKLSPSRDRGEQIYPSFSPASREKREHL